ncbi:MAG: UvrD-helicase domain-containing protein [Myxococcota bacterium]
MSTVDQDARDRIRDALDESLLVEASAGTGKTQATIERILSVLQSGKANVESVVAVTFTRKAAGELKLRLRRALDLRRQRCESHERNRLNHSLRHLDQSRIGTIHSFCADILRRFPAEAGIDPDFVELSEGQSRSLFQVVVRRWFEGRLADPPPCLRRILARPNSQTGRREGPLRRIGDAAWKLAEVRDMSSPWPKPETQPKSLSELAERARDIGQRLAVHAPRMERVLAQRKFEPFLVWAHQQRYRIESDPLELEADLLQVIRYGELPKYGRGVDGQPLSELASDLKALKADVEAHRTYTEQLTASELRDLLWEVVENYQDLKLRSGRLDYADLILSTRALIENPVVRSKLSGALSHLFVDEFQDVDPQQAAIFDTILSDPESGSLAGGRIFLVGDPKQSIYGFRRADMDFYLSYREQLPSRGVSLVRLTHSFRSTERLQTFLNHAFQPLFDPDPSQPAYVELAGGAPESEGEIPSIVAFSPPEVRPQSPREGFASAIRRGSAEGLGRFVAWMLKDSGWTIRDPDEPGLRRPVTASDIGILFRSLRHSFGVDPPQVLVQELERQSVPWVMVGRRCLSERDELSAVKAVLSAIEWPHDQYWMYAALRSPFFFLTDDLLATWKERFGSFVPRAEAPEDLSDVASSIDLIFQLSAERNHRSVTGTLYEVFKATRALGAFAHEYSGPESVAQLRSILHLADQHEQEEQPAFRAFVERLDDIQESELGDEHVEAEGVRIITTHSAKGLEFPIVVLADPGEMLRSRVDRDFDRETGVALQPLMGFRPAGLPDSRPGLGEELRVLYVAATRARDALVICTGNQAFSRQTPWSLPLQSTVRAVARRRPEASPFWPDGRPTCFGIEEHEPMDSLVSSGRYRHDGFVVDWPPAELFRSETKRRPILRHIDALKADGPAAEPGTRAYRAWQTRRVERGREGRVPSAVLVRASETDLDPPGRRPPISVEELPRSSGRPSGRRFGRLVHELLRRAEKDELPSSSERIARQLGAPAEERASAVAAVQAALDHPLLRQAAESPRVHRELSITLETEEGLLVDGVIDLAFLSGGSWVVVDYKTDADLETRMDATRRQLSWYIYSVERVLGPVQRGIVLKV